MGHADTSGDAAVALSYDPSITGAATSTYVSGVTTGCGTPATVGTMSTVGNSARPVIGSGIMAVTSCSVAAKGTPCAPASAFLPEGTGITTGDA